MVATREKWENETLLPRNPSPEQMLAFFGIPPYSAEALDENIKKKRRRWNRLSNSGNADGREKAEKVLALIQRLSEAVKRGAEGEQGGGVESEIPAEVYETVEELWHILEEYLFAFEYDDAIRVARDAVKRWQNADAAGALAWVVAATVSSDGFASPALLAEGLDAARVAIRDQPGVVRNWESTASLLLADSKVAEAIGASIIRRAVEQPLRTLVENAGGEGSVVVNEVKGRKGNEGYNVATGEYVDLVKAGVGDPTKVTRSALQNAASISGLLLTTECVVTELPEKDKPAAPGGHGGGMGGMGGMDY